MDEDEPMEPGSLASIYMSMENMTDEEYLHAVLGPQHMGYKVLIPMTLVYSVIFLTGVIGNLCVCIVIIRNKSLHTATNYYLFSLALADLVILVLGLPYELTMYWQQYPWIFGNTLCKVRALISEMTSYASVLTIVAFSMERYLAICHPLYQYAMSGFSRAVKIIAFIWVLSFSAAFPYAYFTKVNYIDRPVGSGNYLEESALCALLDSNIIPQGYPLHQLSSVVFFLLPLIVLIFLYIRMGFSIHHTNMSRTGNSRVHGTSTLSRNKDIVLRMLAAVVVAFFVCWAPFHAQRLGYVYFRHNRTFGLVNEYLFYISGFFYYFSATVNPVLYNVMSLKYRHAFKVTLCGRSTSQGVVRTYKFTSTVNQTLDSEVQTTQLSLKQTYRSNFSGSRAFIGQLNDNMYTERGMIDMSCHIIKEEDSSSSSKSRQNYSYPSPQNSFQSTHTCCFNSSQGSCANQLLNHNNSFCCKSSFHGHFNNEFAVCTQNSSFTDHDQKLEVPCSCCYCNQSQILPTDPKKPSQSKEVYQLKVSCDSQPTPPLMNGTSCRNSCNSQGSSHGYASQILCASACGQPDGIDTSPKPVVRAKEKIKQKCKITIQTKKADGGQVVQERSEDQTESKILNQALQYDESTDNSENPVDKEENAKDSSGEVDQRSK